MPQHVETGKVHACMNACQVLFYPLPKKPTYKLHIHVAEVVMEMALDRIERLNNSEGRTQPIGAVTGIVG
jgi:hypothetical protein